MSASGPSGPLVYISGVSSICSEKNCIAFFVNLLTKSVFVYLKNLRFCSF